MIQVICDKCKRDCDAVAYTMKVEVIHNPVPRNPLDRGDLRITDDNSFIRMILCQKCYGDLGLPNIYEVQSTGRLKFGKEK